MTSEDDSVHRLRDFVSGDPLARLPEEEAEFGAAAVEEGYLDPLVLEECLQTLGETPLSRALVERKLLTETKAQAVRDILKVRRAGRPGPPGFERLGRYRLREILGEGGMGVVFRARDEELGRDVAVKMLKTAWAFSAGQVERFRREQQNAARLKHPGIVTIFDVGQERDVVYYAMEFVDGRPFNPLEGELKARVAVLEKVARAVQHAHEQGVIHRDLKPANILVDRNGAPHLLDFGLSRYLDEESALTRSGAVLGTPSYMSPEQAGGRARDVDARADIYALGAMLYEALEGRVPFPGETVAEIVHKTTTETPSPPSGPPELSTVCQKAMEKQPNDRYPTAAAFADDLTRWLSGEPILARPVPTWRRLTRKVARRNTLVPAAAAVCLLAAGVAVGRMAIGRQGEDLPKIPITEPTLIGHWTLDEGQGTRAIDSSGHGHHGTIRGATWTEGIKGKALRFTGNGTWVELPDVPDLDRLPSGTYSVTAWFRPDDIPTRKQRPDQAYGIVMKPGFHIGICYGEDGYFQVLHYLPGNVPAHASTSGPFEPGRFHFVAAVVNRETATTQLFVNGTLEDTTKWKDPGPAVTGTSSTWRFGIAGPKDTGNRLAARGVIDEVRLYRRALSAAEIRALAALK